MVYGHIDQQGIWQLLMKTKQMRSFIEYHLNTRVFKSIYSKQRLDKYRRDNECPVNDVLCEDIALWMGQRVLLGTKKDMEDIAEGIAKIQKHSAKLL